MALGKLLDSYVFVFVVKVGPTVDGRTWDGHQTMQIMGNLPYQLVSRISEPSTVCVWRVSKTS